MDNGWTTWTDERLYEVKEYLKHSLYLESGADDMWYEKKHKQVEADLNMLLNHPYRLTSIIRLTQWANLLRIADENRSIVPEAKYKRIHKRFNKIIRNEIGGEEDGMFRYLRRRIPTHNGRTARDFLY